MKTALYVARVMHYDLTVANASSWQWWRALGGNYRDGLLKEERSRRDGNRREGGRSVVKDSKLLWTIGNFSRFVRPGAVRLAVEGGNDDPYGVMISAYRNADNSIVIVAINYSDKDQEVSLEGIPSTTTLSLYRTSDEEGENIKFIGNTNTKKVNLKARSVTTLKLTD